MNASKVQLVMSVGDPKSAMDREVCAPGIQLTVENTGINVILVQIIQEEIIRDAENVYIYRKERGRGPGKETEEIIMSNFVDLLGRLNELHLFSPEMFCSVPGT